MLHRYFKWRYERKARTGSFKLPKVGKHEKLERSNLGSYLSQSSGSSRSLRPFDLPRKRRKIVKFIAVAVIVSIIIWVAYESLIALAMIGN